MKHTLRALIWPCVASPVPAPGGKQTVLSSSEEVRRVETPERTMVAPVRKRKYNQPHMFCLLTMVTMAGSTGKNDSIEFDIIVTGRCLPGALEI